MCGGSQNVWMRIFPNKISKVTLQKSKLVEQAKESKKGKELIFLLHHGSQISQGRLGTQNFQPCNKDLVEIQLKIKNKEGISLSFASFQWFQSLK